MVGTKLVLVDEEMRFMISNKSRLIIFFSFFSDLYYALWIKLPMQKHISQTSETKSLKLNVDPVKFKDILILAYV